MLTPGAPQLDQLDIIINFRFDLAENRKKGEQSFLK